MARKKECLRDMMEFFGVEFSEIEKKEESVGTCFKCDKEAHLYVSKKKNVFKCHRCGVNGNTSDFMDFIWSGLKELISDDNLHALAKFRRLPLEAFLNVEIGYRRGSYYFPVKTPSGRITDFRWYTLGKKEQSITGAISGLYGLDKIAKEHAKFDRIYICEGIMDAIGMNYLINQNGANEIALSLPGVNNFKMEWAPYFLEQNVALLYDSDSAAVSGRNKVFSIMPPPMVKELKYVHWPAIMPTGYDINDYISSTAVKEGKYAECFNSLRAMLVNVGNEGNEESSNKDSPSMEKEWFIDRPVGIDELIGKYRLNLELNDNYVNAIRLCLATILSIGMRDKDPVWVFLVGPPGFGKTAILSSFKNCSTCVFQSSLSKQNLISGWKTENGKDPSLLPKLRDKTLILKDYTEVLAKHKTDRDEIFSILRGAFDGEVDRVFGNQQERHYHDLHFPALAGVTDEIQRFSQTSLGERFLKFDIHSLNIDQEAQQLKAVNTALFGLEDTEELSAFVNHFLLQEWDFSKNRIKQIYSESEYITKLNALCRLTAWIRTSVPREEFSRTNRVAYAPRKESANRLSVQLHKLAISLTIMEDKLRVDESIYKLLKKIAYNTVDGYGFRILKRLHTNGASSVVQINGDIQLAREQIYGILEDLQLVGLVEQDKFQTNGSSSVTHYYLNNEVKKLWALV